MVGIYTRFLLGPGLFSVANLLLVLGSVFILIFILGFHSSGHRNFTHLDFCWNFRGDFSSKKTTQIGGPKNHLLTSLRNPLPQRLGSLHPPGQSGGILAPFPRVFFWDVRVLCFAIFFLTKMIMFFIIFLGEIKWINELKCSLFDHFSGRSVCGYVLNDSNFRTFFFGGRIRIPYYSPSIWGNDIKQNLKKRR